MQYVLTEEEYDNLRKRGKHLEQKQVDALGKLCIDVAKYKPTFKGWDGKNKAEPWGCYHATYTEEENEAGLGYMGYCDECSVQNICPLTQVFSK